MRAAVLGYGPAGLIAAKVLIDEGHEVDVIGAGGKSVVGGAQYLHENVLNPNHTEPEGIIEFVKIGNAEGYANKVYGDESIETSWQHYEGAAPAWALGPVYDVLWHYFQDKLIHDTFNGMSLSMLLEAGKYDIVFSSIPLHCLCLFPSSHNFPRVGIKLVNVGAVKANNIVIYSGRPEDQWYRTSKIFGEEWMEFGAHSDATVVYDDSEGDMRVAEVHHGFKPLGTNCDCHPDVVRIGRFGLWDRKILLHHVPGQVRAALKERAS